MSWLVYVDYHEVDILSMREGDVVEYFVFIGGAPLAVYVEHTGYYEVNSMITNGEYVAWTSADGVLVGEFDTFEEAVAAAAHFRLPPEAVA